MQITTRIHAIKIPFKIRMPTGICFDRYVYVYIVYGKKIYVIDTGVASSEKIIFDHIAASGRRPDEIDLIMLTHSHPDHIGSAGAIKARAGCKVAAHKAERNWIEDVGLQFSERPVPGFHSLVGGPVKVDWIVNDGEVLRLEDDMCFEVLHTPGHSRGSISLFLRDENAMFSGDAIFVPGDMPLYEDVSLAVSSIKKLRAFADIKHLLSAWDEPMQNGKVSQAMDGALDYLKTIHKSIEAIAHRRQMQDPMDLCKQVVTELKLPALLLNPLVAKAFESNLKYLNDDLFPT